MRRHTVRYLVCVVVSTLLTLPLGVAWAVTHTEVHEKVGTSPTTFSLTTRGHSELRLGIAGTVYLPLSRGPLGVVAEVQGPGDPGAGDGDLAAYARPEMLRLYAGLFHDPGEAVQGYVDLVALELRHQLLLAELVLGLGGGLLLLALVRLLGLGGSRGDPHRRARLVLAAALVLASTSGIGWAQLRAADRGGSTSDGVYALQVLDGTAVAGSTTNSPVLRALLGGALGKTRQLVERQERQAQQFRDVADDDLHDQLDLMAGPRDGETAVMMQSDMHCNTSMIHLQSEVVDLLRREHGDDVPAALAITGDLTTNGTAAEGGCIDDEAAIADGAPVAAVTGNHESDVSAAQMADAGMTVLDGSTTELAGVRFLGDGDPARSELFGATRLRGEETEEEAGQRLRGVAEDGDRPDMVLVHEAYAAAGFLGVDEIGPVISGAGSPTRRREDDVADVPAAAVFYGHWHRSVPPRVVWNDDGTWTLVMELDTSGGAVDTPTINRFSTPWSRPLQEASFPVVFLDRETRLVTGYQIYSFATDGHVTVEPRVDVGAPLPPGEARTDG